MAEGEHGPTTISEGHHAVAAVGTLVALTLASFAYVVAEALPIGLLPRRRSRRDTQRGRASGHRTRTRGRRHRRPTDPCGLASWISGGLLLFGLAGTGGILLAAAAVQRRPRATTTIAPVMLSAALAALAALGTHHIALLVILVAWGAAMAALPSTLQTRVLTVAPMNTPTASSVYVAVFNGGIACGALLGAALLDHGDLALLPVAGAVLALLAVPPAILSRARPDLTA